ncbi:MAG: hypothetical protein ACLFV3_12270 [Phycisphaeraceae bacterium]
MFSFHRIAKVGSLLLAAPLALAMTTAAHADSVLYMDLNSFVTSGQTLQSPEELGNSSATATFNLFDDLDTEVTQILAPAGQEEGDIPARDFVGEITFTYNWIAAANQYGGTIDGGSFTLTDPEGDSYSVGGMSGAVYGTGTSFKLEARPGAPGIDGQTSGGTFDLTGDGTFFGIDVSAWAEEQPVNGTLLQFDVDTTQNLADGVFQDPTSSAEIEAIVPSPAAATVGIPALALLGLGYLARRRRMMA